ncbi:MAG: protein NosL [Gammaproteobacteria bacterium]|nr:protein NosL [Gammaproteobacteria bacterium]
MRRFLLLGLLAFLSSCSKVDTGPVEVKWDRDACERCRMVLSDRLHSAQVRNGTNAKVYLFDDIGGAILWLSDKDWADHPKTEIWVNHHTTGVWLDARKAVYISGQNTPMAFGLGAQSEPVAGALNYQQAVQYIYDREKRFNQAGSDLKGQVQDEHH